MALAWVALLVLLAGGCSLGGGDDAGGGDGGGRGGGGNGQGGAASASARTEDYVEALAGSMTAGEVALYDERTAACVAGQIVDVVGVDALDRAGVTPDRLAEADSLPDLDVELPADATERLRDGLGACDVGPSLRPALLANLRMDAGMDLPPEATACLEGQLTDEAIAGSMAAAFLEGDGQDARAAMGEAIVACPAVPTAIILGRTTALEAPETEDCVRSFVEGNPDMMRSAFVEDDPEAAEELGVQLAANCPVGVDG